MFTYKVLLKSPYATLRLSDAITRYNDKPSGRALFACAGENDSDGAIYIFAVNKRDVRYANSDRVQMLATLAEFRASEQELLWNTAYENVVENKFPQQSNGKYREKMFEQF